MLHIWLWQDFEMNGELKSGVITLLEEVLRDPDLLPQERKATANILRYRCFQPKAQSNWVLGRLKSGVFYVKMSER